jgi:4-hydroxybenzoate polyprenyltransferase
MERRPPDIICVDLDGTLVRTDTLVEGLIRLLRDPRSWAGLPGWLLRGRAYLKRQVAARAPLDPTCLPYEQPLIDFLRGARRAGRRLVLATAADLDLARAVSAHLGLFDEVIASNGKHNMKSGAKGAALVERYGRGNFTYVGNSRPDLDVWRQAGTAILVNTSKRLAQKVARIAPVERRFDTRPNPVRVLLTALRPHQWLKNVLVFVPIVTANALKDGSAWASAAVIFVAFCATASAIYIVNDVTDLAADRSHPRKRLRPFASGALSPAAGLALVPLLLVVGIALGVVAGTASVIVLYAACSLAYSIKLKELPLVDVFLLAFLYTLRLYGGAEATDYHLSPWLFAFSIFLFLGLAMIKRVGELLDLSQHEGAAGRRGYRAGDVAILQAMGVGASFVAAMVLALFVQSDSVAARYAQPHLLWAVVPLMLFWQCRLWLATVRGQMSDDPIVYAARDWVSRLVAAAGVVVFLMARGLASRVG